MHEPEPSDELARASQCTLGAAVDIETILQGEEGSLTELAQLAQILDTEGTNERNAPFFHHILKEIGHSGLRTVSDVQSTMKDIVRKLRTIEVFRMGDLGQMKEFCFELNRSLIAASWRHHTERRYVA